MSKPSFSFARVVTMLVLAIVILVGVYFVKTREWQEQAANVRMPHMLIRMGLDATAPMQLDPQFTDADGDLVADAPKDPAQLATPDQIVFCFITSDTADSERSSWSELADFVSKRVGKRAEIVTFDTAAEEIQALPNGKSTWLALILATCQPPSTRGALCRFAR